MGGVFQCRITLIEWTKTRLIIYFTPFPSWEKWSLPDRFLATAKITWNRAWRKAWPLLMTEYFLSNCIQFQQCPTTNKPLERLKIFRNWSNKSIMEWLGDIHHITLHSCSGKTDSVLSDCYLKPQDNTIKTIRIWSSDIFGKINIGQ